MDISLPFIATEAATLQLAASRSARLRQQWGEPSGSPGKRWVYMRIERVYHGEIWNIWRETLW